MIEQVKNEYLMFKNIRKNFRWIKIKVNCRLGIKQDVHILM